HVERKTIGGVTDKFRMQQRRQRTAIPRGERLVKPLGGCHFGVERLISTHLPTGLVPGLALDMSVMSGQRRLISCSVGGVGNVTPSFWNCATHWTSPPPTTKTDPVS